MATILSIDLGVPDICLLNNQLFQFSFLLSVPDHFVASSDWRSTSTSPITFQSRRFGISSHSQSAIRPRVGTITDHLDHGLHDRDNPDQLLPNEISPINFLVSGLSRRFLIGIISITQAKSGSAFWHPLSPSRTRISQRQNPMQLSILPEWQDQLDSPFIIWTIPYHLNYNVINGIRPLSSHFYPEKGSENEKKGAKIPPRRSDFANRNIGVTHNFKTWSFVNLSKLSVDQ
jgi:hypothetical protein